MKRNIAVVLFFVALASMVFAKTRVKRVGEDNPLDLDGYWNDTDVSKVCKTLIDDCVASPRITKFQSEKGHLPVVIVGKIKNESSERIDTTIVAKRFQTAILNSGMLEFVASADERGELRDEKVDQALHATPESAKTSDIEQAADFMLIGSVKTIVQHEGKYTARTYDVTATLVDIENNRLIWQGQDTSIRKLIKRQKKQR